MKLLFLVALFFAALAPAAHAGSCANADTVWCGNFDTDPVVSSSNGEYSELLGSPDRVTFPTAPVLASSGTRSGRFELHPGDTWTDGTNRMQLRRSGPTWGEGTDLYFHVAVYIPNSLTITSSIGNPWRAIFSWPTTEDGKCSTGGFGLEGVDASNHVAPNGTPALDVQGDGGVCGSSDTMYWKLKNPLRVQWYQFIEHRYLSSDPSLGLFELWMKAPGSTSYVRQTFLDGSQTMHMATLGCSGCHANMRIGLYRNPAFTTTDVMVYDDVRAATTLTGAK